MSLSIHCVLLLLLFGVCLNVGAGALDEPLKPLPAVPSLDPLRVEIGRRLFNDSQLSVTGTVSCASCHQLAKGGADTQAFSIGATGLAAPVNTPSVFNTSLNFRYFWDGRAQSPQAQLEEGLHSPGEMGSNWPHVVQTLASNPAYQKMFAEAYPDGITANTARDALITYQRTLLSGNSRFDQYLRGDTEILSKEEKYGYQRFKSYGCAGCHQGVNIGGNMLQKFGVMADYFQARGQPTEADLGRYRVTRDELDRNVFKVPSLRNVAVTAPYFHDASATTLEEAVDVMFKYQLGRIPSVEDKTLIIKFLKTLTGEWEGKPL